MGEKRPLKEAERTRWRNVAMPLVTLTIARSQCNPSSVKNSQCARLSGSMECMSPMPATLAFLTGCILQRIRTMMASIPPLWIV
jgi:hypothetical protein